MGKFSGTLMLQIPHARPQQQIPGAPHLARVSRDVGYHRAQPESIRLTINT
jgi:hypothetical protein